MMHHTVHFRSVSTVISGIKYEKEIKARGKGSVLRFRRIEKGRGRKEKREKKKGVEKKKTRRAWKSSPTARLLCFSFFPACELHKENMYTVIPPLSELPSLLLKFLKPIGFFDVTPCFPRRSQYRNFLIIFTLTRERTRHFSFSLFSSSKFLSDSVWPMQGLIHFGNVVALACSFLSNDSPRTRSSTRFVHLFSPLKTGLVWKRNSRCSFRSVKDIRFSQCILLRGYLRGNSICSRKEAPLKDLWFFILRYIK